MISQDDFRRIALGMAGAIEAAHMGHPDFRVNGRIFATLQPWRECGALIITPEQQAALLRDHPEAFEPESGAWGRQGSTRVRLAHVDLETAGEAVTLAWQHISAKAPARAKAAVARPATRARSKRAPSAKASPRKRRAASGARKAPGRKSAKKAAPRRGATAGRKRR